MSDDNQEDNDVSIEESVDLEKLQSDLSAAMDGWKRTTADFDNYRRRKELENKELVDFAREVTVAKLLPALDSLEQALKHMPDCNLSVSIFAQASADKSDALDIFPEGGEGEHAPQPSPGVPPIYLERGNNPDFPKQYQNWQTGVNGIVVQLDKTLAELGVKKIEALGKKFDPNFHEAVREVESEVEDEMVVDELQTGFELNGKVIRPSQVTISKKADSSL